MMKLDTAEIAELYNTRYSNHGRDIKTVGWGNANDQLLRFQMLFRGLSPVNKTILDVGCGLGDLVPFLDQVTGGNFNYIGVDIAENLIKDATATYGRDGVTFITGEIMSLQLPIVDIAVLSGALSFKTPGIEQYAEATLKKMFDLTTEAACLNFLTKYVDFELEKNQHYAPEKIFEKSMAVCKKVALFHDYPLYEFTIQLIH
jgi:SAM-dependent methyltransferase